MDELREDGFAIIRNAFKKEDIEGLSSTIKKIFSGHSQPGEDIFATCERLDKEDRDLLYRIYQYSPTILVMDLLRQKCFEYAKAYFKDEDGVYIYVDSHVIINLHHSGRISWGWHQESTYHPEIEKCIGFWFPFLEPSTKSNGTMSVLKGSHLKGQLPYSIHKSTVDSATTLEPNDIEKYEVEFAEVHCFLDPGDLLMFDQNLVHRSNSNISDRARFTVVIRIACIDKIPSHFDVITRNTN